MTFFNYLPTVNAGLNFTCAVLLVTGHSFIERGKKDVHKKFMIAAFTVSIVFLISYLTYHAYHGTTTFPGTGAMRTLYFAILGTHTILAATVPFLAVISLRRGLKNEIVRHKKIAR